MYWKIGWLENAFFLLVCSLMIVHKLGPIKIWGPSFMLKGFGSL